MIDDDEYLGQFPSDDEQRSDASRLNLNLHDCVITCAEVDETQDSFVVIIPGVICVRWVGQKGATQLVWNLIWEKYAAAEFMKFLNDTDRAILKTRLQQAHLDVGGPRQ
jgi:hypothetical protein